MVPAVLRLGVGVLCVVVASGLVVAPSRVAVLRPTLQKEARLELALGERRRARRRVAATAPRSVRSMAPTMGGLFGLSKMFNWLSPSDVMFTVAVAAIAGCGR